MDIFSKKIHILLIFFYSAILLGHTSYNPVNINNNVSKGKITMDDIWLNSLSEQQLSTEIERHNKLYWEDSAPEISDEEYDILMRRLEDINPDNPLLRNVGAAEVASLGKVKLSEPMISLEKTYFFKDAPKGKKSLMEWAEELKRSENEEFLIQPKYDGISANYLNGILATRGQGSEDENVSDKVPLIELETKGYTGPLDRDVRGEIIIRNDDFKNLYSNIKKADGGKYKNSRNAVGGIMGLKDISAIQAQGGKLTIIDYNMISHTVKFFELEKRWTEIVEEFEALPYPMDGIVVKLADVKYRDSLGSTAHHPRGQIAFKFSGVRKKTTLIDVEWSFGKNCLTPVGKIDPVEIGGVTISNVTLHNIGMVEDNDWQVGDIVTIERAGDVIPHIIESEPGENRKSFIIDICPSCNSTLIRESKELRCVNPHCFETNLQRILAAVRNIGIEELGEPNIRKMMKDLNVEHLKDIFDLKLTDIYSLEGFKDKSSRNLYNNIQIAKDAADYQLIAALNIEGIGQVSSGKILRDYHLNELRNMSKLQMSFIPEIGTETSEKLFSSLKEQADTLDELLETLNVTDSKENDTPKELVCFDFETKKLNKPVKEYENLLKLHNLNRVKPVQIDSEVYLPENLTALVSTKNKESNNRLFKKAREMNIPILTPEEWETSLPEIEENIDEIKTICFTGKMPEKRSYYENIAIERGFTPVSAVNSELNLLVADNPEGNSSKIKKAKKAGIEVIALKDWLENKPSKPKENQKKDGVSDTNADQGMLPGF